MCRCNVHEQLFIVSSHDLSALKYLCRFNGIDSSRKIASYISYDTWYVPVTDLWNSIHKITILSTIFDSDKTKRFIAQNIELWINYQYSKNYSLVRLFLLNS